MTNEHSWLVMTSQSVRDEAARDLVLGWVYVPLESKSGARRRLAVGDESPVILSTSPPPDTLIMLKYLIGAKRVLLPQISP